MARFDRDGRPIPLDRPPGKDRRPSLAPGRRPGARRPSLGQRLGPLLALLDLKKAAPFGWAIAALIFFFVELVTDDGPDPDQPQIIALPAPPVIADTASIEATRLAALERQDPAALEHFFRHRAIRISGTVRSIELAGQYPDRVALESGIPSPIQLDVDSDSDSALRDLRPGDRTAFLCARGQLFEAEILLFDCRLSG